MCRESVCPLLCGRINLFLSPVALCHPWVNRVEELLGEEGGEERVRRTDGRVRACRLTRTARLHIPHSFPKAGSPPRNAAGSCAPSHRSRLRRAVISRCPWGSAGAPRPEGSGSKRQLSVTTRTGPGFLKMSLRLEIWGIFSPRWGGCTRVGCCFAGGSPGTQTQDCFGSVALALGCGRSCRAGVPCREPARAGLSVFRNICERALPAPTRTRGTSSARGFKSQGLFSVTKELQGHLILIFERNDNKATSLPGSPKGLGTCWQIKRTSGYAALGFLLVFVLHFCIIIILKPVSCFLKGLCVCVVWVLLNLASAFVLAGSDGGDGSH